MPKSCNIVIAHGMWADIMDFFGIDGLTMPWKTIYLRPECYLDGPLIIHELVHIAQIKRLGPIKFSLRYLYEMVRYGYDNSPLEIEARSAQLRAYNVKFALRSSGHTA